MVKFTPRTTVPEKNNKYYNTKSAGGYSTCVVGNYPKNAGSSRTGWPGLNVLPNCVGYSSGRFNEISAEKWKYSIPGNAEDMFYYAKQMGLPTGSEPKLGAILVWQKGALWNGSDGAGHVANVEAINADGSITLSESGWSSNSPFWTAIHFKGKDGNWIEGDDYSWMKGAYKFVGFIYNPDLEFSFKTGDSFEVNEIPYYKSSVSTDIINYWTGTLFIWSDKVIKNRIRFTNCAENVGKSSQVTGWVDIDDLKDQVVNPSPTPTVTFFDYSVVAGDTLWKISEKFYGNGAKYIWIIEDNHLTSTVIYVGQTLKIRNV